MSDKTPDILIPALRQYQHNDCSGLLAGFDYDETVKIVTNLQQQILDICQPHWIPVAERLPDERCIAYTDNEDITIAYRFIPARMFKQIASEATHWKPLPPPPEDTA